MITKRISTDFNSNKINFDFYEICITDQLSEDKDTLDSFLFDCQCILLLIDITDKESLNIMSKFLENIDLSIYSVLKIILIENKIDLDKKREIDNETITNFMNEKHIEDKIQLSIKEGTGFDELINKMNTYTNKTNNDIPINYISQDININNPNINLEKNITLILIGDSNVGKTCFFTRFNRNQFQETFLSTIGMDKYVKYYKYKDEQVRITLWDTAGQDRYKSLPKKYYQNADGIFLFYDVSSKESFNDVSVWMNEINDNTKFEEKEEFENIENYENENIKKKKKPKKENKVIVYLIGNKIDKLNRCVSKEDAEEKAEFYGIKYFEMSCKLNMNIGEITTRMVNDCYLKIEENKDNEEDVIIKRGSFSLKKKKNIHKNKGCCGGTSEEK